MRPGGCEAELLRLLAEMPFLDRLEMAEVSGWSRGAVYGAVEKLESGGFCAPAPHAADPLPSTRRFHLTAAGLGRLAEQEGLSPDESGAPVSRLRPVAAQPDGAPGRPGRHLPAGLRRLHRRLPHPVPLVPLPAPGRRPDPARRQDRGHPPAGTHRRPHRLRQAPLAAARGTRARHGAGPDGRRGAPHGTPAGCCPHPRCRPCWPWKARRRWLGRATASGVPPPSTPSWTCATSWNGPTPRRGASGGGPAAAATLPEDFAFDGPGWDIPDHLLPVLLKSAEKRALDLVSDWPWLT